MNVIPKSFRIRINRAAHDQALRHEMQLRDMWSVELSEAMQGNASYDELQAMIVRMETAERPPVQIRCKSHNKPQ